MGTSILARDTDLITGKCLLPARGSLCGCGLHLAHLVLGVETWFLPCSVFLPGVDDDPCLVLTGEDGPEAQTGVGMGAGVGVPVSLRV